MSKLDELINELCPNGVEFKELWEVTIWDKKFTTVAKAKQEKVIKYKYYLANELKEVVSEYGDVKILTTNITDLWAEEKDVENDMSIGEIVCIPGGGNPIVQYYNGKFITGDNRIATSKNTNTLSNKYLYYYLLNNLDEIASFYRGSGIKHPSMKDMLNLSIPIPPIAVQEEIVRLLDNFTELTAELKAELKAELEARKKQYEYYRNELLTFGDDVEWKKLEDVFYLRNGYTPSKAKKEYWENGTIPWFRMEDIRANGRILNDAIQKVNVSGVKNGNFFEKNTIILATSATIGEHALVTTPYLCNQRFTNFKPKEQYENKLDYRFIYYYFFIVDEWCKLNTNKASMSSVDMNGLKKFKFPIPPLDEQKRIVEILDRFDKLCNDISAGLPAEIEARQKQYEYYRDQLLTFKELE